jgi:hypothetical protein
MPIVLEDRIANRDTFIANVGAGVVAGGGDQLAYDILAFMAEGTAQGLVGSGTFHSVSPMGTSGLLTGSLSVPPVRLSIYASIIL